MTLLIFSGPKLKAGITILLPIHFDICFSSKLVMCCKLYFEIKPRVSERKVKFSR